MAKAAILLNLTDKLSFELADPFLSVVNAEGPLLYYDRLTVKEEGADNTLSRPYVARLCTKMRNLLEARAFSTSGDAEKIRLIILLDLTHGALQTHRRICFPAQQVRAFKEVLTEAFGQGNPLLSHFTYCFVFLTSKTLGGEEESFYQDSLCDGFLGTATPRWLGRNNVQLNALRDKLLQSLDRAPDHECLLERSGLKEAYNRFQDHLADVRRTLSTFLSEAGLDDAFRNLVEELIPEPRTVGDFCSFDFDAAILGIVSRLAGLRSKDFREDCTFFLLPTDHRSAAARRQSEAMAAALVQFLATISPEDYQKHLLPLTLGAPARLFAMGSTDKSDFDAGAMSLLATYVKAVPPVLENTRWKEDQRVEYKHYKPNAEDPMTVDTHEELNDKLSGEREQLFSNFQAVRKVPFFFGSFVGDWSWYKRTVKGAEQLIHFETLNDRPYYDAPKRLSDNEMSVDIRQVSYADIQREIDQMLSEAVPVPKEKDINAYLIGRNKLMDSLKEAFGDMKKKMVRLGFFICLFWLGLLSVLGFTLNYAYHFFLPYSTDNPWLVAAGFGSAAVLFLLAGVIGRAVVKSDLKAVYDRMDGIYRQMQANLKEYLDAVSERVSKQNEADVRRKNIDSLTAVMDAFYRHNKQVDLWCAYFSSIHEKLAGSLQLLSLPAVPPAGPLQTVDENDFELELFTPSMPLSIREKFAGMTVSFTNSNFPIGHLTCFATHLRFTEIKP